MTITEFLRSVKVTWAVLTGVAVVGPVALWVAVDRDPPWPQGFRFLGTLAAVVGLACAFVVARGMIIPPVSLGDAQRIRDRRAQGGGFLVLGLLLAMVYAFCYGTFVLEYKQLIECETSGAVQSNSPRETDPPAAPAVRSQPGTRTAIWRIVGGGERLAGVPPPWEYPDGDIALVLRYGFNADAIWKPTSLWPRRLSLLGAYLLAILTLNYGLGIVTALSGSKQH